MASKTEKKPTSFDDIKDKTAQNYFDEIERKVNVFGKDFMNFLPKSDGVGPNIQIIADKIIGLKASAKYLINQYVHIQELEEQELKNDK